MLVLVGMATAVWRAFRRLTCERVIGPIAIGVVAAAAASMTGVVLLLIVVAIMASTLLIEHRRVEAVTVSMKI